MSYTVKPGDSWAKIAGKLYGGDQRMFGELMRANKGVLTLKAGMKISTPAKVDNPFVGFTQAAWAASTNKDPNKINETMDMISKMKGGTEWINSLPGQTTTKQTPTNLGAVGGPRMEALARLNPAKTNALLSTSQANIPANRAARENTVSRVASPTVAPTSFAQANGPQYNPVQPSMATDAHRKAPGAQPVLAGPAVTANNKGLPAVSNAMSSFGGALANVLTGKAFSNEAQNIGNFVSNFGKSVVGVAGAGAGVSAGTQPLNQPTGTQSPNSTGANAIGQQGSSVMNQVPGLTRATPEEYHNYINTLAVSPTLPGTISTTDAVQIAMQTSPIPLSQTDAVMVAEAWMKEEGYEKVGGLWIKSELGKSEMPDALGTTESPYAQGLDWKSMDLSTLTQLGFYDAPTQPTFSSSGRENQGTPTPAPAYSQMISGTSWRINP